MGSSYQAKLGNAGFCGVGDSIPIARIGHWKAVAEPKEDRLYRIWFQDSGCECSATSLAKILFLLGMYLALLEALSDAILMKRLEESPKRVF